jgi:hypothetical protein
MKKFLLGVLVFYSCRNEGEIRKREQRISYIDSALSKTDTSKLIKEERAVPDSLLSKFGKYKTTFFYENPNKLRLLVTEYRTDISINKPKMDTLVYYMSGFFINNKLAMVEMSCHSPETCLFKSRSYLYGEFDIHKSLVSEREVDAVDLDRLKKMMNKTGIWFIKYKTN